MFVWAVNNHPPHGYPTGPDADNVDEHMTVVALALVLHEAAQADVSTHRSNPVLPQLASAVASPERTRDMVAAAQPATSAWGGRLRISDRARLNAAFRDPETGQWTRWHRTLAEVVNAMTALAQARAELWYPQRSEEAIRLELQFKPGPETILALEAHEQARTNPTLSLIESELPNGDLYWYAGRQR
jgi:hypothetical protein